MNRIALLTAAVLTAACAPLTDRVTVLNGVVTVKADKEQVELSAPYATADVKGGKTVASMTTADDVNRRYGPVLKALPPKPRSYVVFFLLGDLELTPESKQMLETIKQEIAAMPAADIVVIGHTDRYGSTGFNDQLSLKRARLVRNALVAIGVPSDKIELAGRGEREPVVPTGRNVAEAKNRRVEIKVR